MFGIPMSAGFVMRRSGMKIRKYFVFDDLNPPPPFFWYMHNKWQRGPCPGVRGLSALAPATGAMCNARCFCLVSHLPLDEGVVGVLRPLSGRLGDRVP